MRILFEVLERDRFEIYDPCVPAAAETAKIISSSEGMDTVRILKFCPATLQTWDITRELFDAYRGPFDATAPMWVKHQPEFEAQAAEDLLDAREWQRHIHSLSHAA